MMLLETVDTTPGLSGTYCRRFSESLCLISQIGVPKRCLPNFSKSCGCGWPCRVPGTGQAVPPPTPPHLLAYPYPPLPTPRLGLDIPTRPTSLAELKNIQIPIIFSKALIPYMIFTDLIRRISRNFRHTPCFSNFQIFETLDFKKRFEKQIRLFLDSTQVIWWIQSQE